MRVVILVPRRADYGRRDRLWEYVRGRWTDEHPEWEIWEGHHLVGPFNRSKAINTAALMADDWDLAIIADADSFVGTEQIEAAVETCAQTGQMTLGYTTWNALDERMSNSIMNGYNGDWRPGVFASLNDSCSSMVLVTRDLWDECEGFDEGLAGWGCEDIIFAHKARTFGGGHWHHTTPGDLWHLWHESAPRPTIMENVARADRYHAVAGDTAAMRALMAELKTELVSG